MSASNFYMFALGVGCLMGRKLSHTEMGLFGGIRSHRAWEFIYIIDGSGETGRICKQKSSVCMGNYEACYALLE